MKPQVISIVGPTAVGKSELAVQVAHHFNGEVISGDSMQIYKSMDIGTAKVTEKEMEGIPHHMINIKEPNESFSVAEFQERVSLLIDEITARHRLPIIVGGTGLYIQAALYDFNFSNEKRNPDVVEKLEQEAEEHGIESLYRRLKTIDPAQAEKMHPNNKRRVIRALEVYETTGQTLSGNHDKQTQDSPYTPLLIGLEMERAVLYDRINTRVDVMLKRGLEEEVRSLYARGFEDCQSMKAIGYKEFIPYFKGEYSYERAVELLKRNSRRYAKRQFTYFKNKLNVRWYNVNPLKKYDKNEKILAELAGMLEET
ncbi:tRNA dimethylallyltransferase [Halobacillus andaensis]|uniref:tRNA dimethylallyltransferase n=1 Tax=Halobacillus andaensis TaxID=1176239 RepID=A0A917B008_HALAA|nr:tRNA (adenosine(37)-N6)-dimethylallyltransferase MiaA [Halobacillus andaensis]MBP2003412.1 tRNA dimethylallyltransferase [Halobacillus andaensis]GGF10408.1 tRNA dimethylallyltransferase [Halobacillus andaensis]